MTNLLSLPAELHHKVCDQLDGVNRNHDLRNLSLSCSRLRPIAQESLLRKPRFHLKYIAWYLYQLHTHPGVNHRVESVEIFSAPTDWHPVVTRVAEEEDTWRYPHIEPGSFIREYVGLKCPSVILGNRDMRKIFRKVIYEAMTYSSVLHERCRRALKDDVIQGLLAVLWMSVPNLKEVRLAPTMLADFPMFGTILSVMAHTHHLQPFGWKHETASALLFRRKMRIKIEVLEFPANMRHMRIRGVGRRMFGFEGFKALKHLSVPNEALHWIWPPERDPEVVDPESTFPSNLELLRIYDCQDRNVTRKIVDKICRAKRKKDLTGLKRLELWLQRTDFAREHSTLLAALLPESCTSLVKTLPELCQKAEIELLIWNPMKRVKMDTRDIGRTPWSLAEDGMFCRRTMPTCLHWDAAGNVVMEEPWWTSKCTCSQVPGIDRASKACEAWLIDYGSGRAVTATH